MSLSEGLDLVELERIAKRHVKPDYWPDDCAAKEFAEKYPATFLSILNAARAEASATPGQDETKAFDMHGGYGRCAGLGKVWVDDGEQSNFYEFGDCPDCDALRKRIAARFNGRATTLSASPVRPIKMLVGQNWLTRHTGSDPDADVEVRPGASVTPGQEEPGRAVQVPRLSPDQTAYIEGALKREPVDLSYVVGAPKAALSASPVRLEREPTQAEIQKAGWAWRNDKDRETDGSDQAYFETNWRFLPGLGDYVDRVMAAAAGHAPVRLEREAVAMDLLVGLKKAEPLVEALHSITQNRQARKIVAARLHDIRTAIASAEAALSKADAILALSSSLLVQGGEEGSAVAGLHCAQTHTPTPSPAGGWLLQRMFEVCQAAQTYYQGYCQDEAADDGMDFTGCSYEQQRDAKRLADALADYSGEETLRAVQAAAATEGDARPQAQHSDGGEG